MGTRSRGFKRRGSGTKSQEAVAGEGKSATPQTAAAQPTKPDIETPPTIRKGIYLSALIYVEADQPPAEDFTAAATSALKDAFQAALKETSSGLTMTLKKVEVRNDVEEDKVESSEEKFQF